jgi:hypothetical protein
MYSGAAEVDCSPACAMASLHCSTPQPTEFPRPSQQPTSPEGEFFFFFFGPNPSSRIVFVPLGSSLLSSSVLGIENIYRREKVLEHLATHCHLPPPARSRIPLPRRCCGGINRYSVLAKDISPKGLSQASNLWSLGGTTDDEGRPLKHRVG